MDLRKQAFSIDISDGLVNGTGGDTGGGVRGGGGMGVAVAGGGGGSKGGRSSLIGMNISLSDIHPLGGGEEGERHSSTLGMENTATVSSGQEKGPGQGPGPGLGKGVGWTSDSSVSRATNSTPWSSYVLNKRDMDLARLQLLNTKMRIDHLSSSEVTTITSHLLTTIPQIQSLFATMSYDHAHSILCQLVAVSTVVHLKRSSTNPLYPRWIPSSRGYHSLSFRVTSSDPSLCTLTYIPYALSCSSLTPPTDLFISQCQRRTLSQRSLDIIMHLHFEW